MAKSVIFNMEAAAILDFAVYQFCIYNQLWDPICYLCVKFGVNPFKKWPSYGLITDFKVAAAVILDFCTM